MTFLVVLYFIIVLVVSIRIVWSTTTPSKGLAYLLLVITFPIIGILFYLSVGLNYRKSKLYKKKIKFNINAYPRLIENVENYTDQVLKRNQEKLGNFYSLANLLCERNILSDDNKAMLITNGEEKFPHVLESLRNAKNHIHIEYYIYEDDDIGREIANILIAKVKEGVKVRFIYDDFGAKNIRKKLVKDLRQAGVEAYPFYKINFIQFANRLNYRNHRKIIVVDGVVGYLGGINVSDKYINTPQSKLFWRDTHTRIEGLAVANLQFIFLTDWNFCANQDLEFSSVFFPFVDQNLVAGNQLVQIISSGPDSDYPSIMYSYIQSILLAKECVRITTPYFIPDKSFLDAIKIAALSGLEVRLLIPGVSDSWIVNMTSQSYYEELLIAGVKIHKYQKGFVHAKTMVCDHFLSSIGTTNLDNRSFDLNFEINALVYDVEFAKMLTDKFNEDLTHAEEILLDQWKTRPVYIKIIEKTFQLFSSLM